MGRWVVPPLIMSAPNAAYALGAPTTRAMPYSGVENYGCPGRYYHDVLRFPVNRYVVFAVNRFVQLARKHNEGTNLNAGAVHIDVTQDPLRILALQTFVGNFPSVVDMPLRQNGFSKRVVKNGCATVR